MMRDLIQLLEEREHLERVKLKYSHSAFTPVLSKTNIDNHYDKLYKGYVDRYNKHEGDDTFNKAGAFLHDILFQQFRPVRGANAPYGASLALINQHFGTFIDFKKALKEEALTIQGSGWIYLSRSGTLKVIKNHAERKDIALLIDMWEHAWLGSDKKKYLDNIWKVIDWERVNRRIYSGK
jgi:Fe-Mn family superoxide dismutase